MNLLVRSFHAGKPSESHAVRGMLDTVQGVFFVKESVISEAVPNA